MKKKICFLNDGCGAHRDIFRQILESLGDNYDVTILPNDADVVILYTCGFAKWDGSSFFGALADLSESKKKGATLIITGCGTAMYDKEELLSLEFVDYVVGFNDCVKNICTILKCHKAFGYYLDDFPGKLYLEITSGCYKEGGYCYFCKCYYLGIKVKTLLTIEEVCDLVRKNETPILILGGLNTTIYRDGDSRLHDLLREVSKIETLKWIELYSVASSGIYPELLKEIKENPKVYAVNYFVQSGSNRMLKLMNVGSTVEFNEMVLSELKGKCISSGLVVSYPGEGLKDLEETIEFITRNNLWYLEVMPYKYSLDTPSSKMKQLPTKDYREHHSIIYEVVDQLAHEFLDNLVGKRLDGFIDSIVIGEDGVHTYCIRPLRFWGMINVFSERIECEIGDTVSVEVTKIHEYHPATIEGRRMEVL